MSTPAMRAFPSVLPTAHHLLPGHVDDQRGTPEAAEGPVLL